MPPVFYTQELSLFFHKETKCFPARTGAVNTTLLHIISNAVDSILFQSRNLRL